MSATVNVGSKIPNGLQTQFGTLNGFQPHSGIEAGFTSVDIETWLEMKNYLNNFVSKGIIFVDPKEESQAINSHRDQSIAEFKSLGITEVKSGLIAEHFGKGLKKIFAEEWLASEIETVHNPAASLTDKEPAAEKPKNISLIAIAEGVISGFVLICFVYLIYTHFGLKLN